MCVGCTCVCMWGGVFVCVCVYVGGWGVVYARVFKVIGFLSFRRF